MILIMFPLLLYFIDHISVIGLDFVAIVLSYEFALINKLPSKLSNVLSCQNM